MLTTTNATNSSDKTIKAQLNQPDLYEKPSTIATPMAKSSVWWACSSGSGLYVLTTQLRHMLSLIMLWTVWTLLTPYFRLCLRWYCNSPAFHGAIQPSKPTTVRTTGFRIRGDRWLVLFVRKLEVIHSAQLQDLSVSTIE